MKSLHVDIETFSDVDLKKCGVAKYAESPLFQVLLFGYCVDDGPEQVVDLASGEEIPGEILVALFDHNVRKKAFNAQFEMTCLRKHFGADMPPEQWECTSVHALYLGLPNDLDSVCGVIGAPNEFRKQKTGHALIRTFCVPCKPTIKNGGRTRNLPHHEPEKWELFKSYCAADVRAERYVGSRLVKFPVPEKERRLWIVDQHMFLRGVGVDMDLVDAAMYCDETVKDKLTHEAVSLTGLSNPNSVQQLIGWLQEEMDEEVTDLRKKTVPKLLESASSSTVERVLRLRQELSKSSVKKYEAMARSAGADGRLRGVTQFYGANRTGRWAGRIVQLQNLPQNKLPDLELARELVKARDIDAIEMLFGSVPDVLSQLIRTALVPAPGRRLYVSDFSAIEARVIAWLAGCKWRLDVFNTHGEIYEASAEQMFKLPRGSVTKKSPYREKGKIAELALGYQGGVNALITMGALDMGIPQEGLEEIKRAWRAANPEIVRLWYAVETAMKEAIARGTDIELKIADGRSKLVFGYEKKFLTITLPSGRKLFYAKARLEPEDLYTENAAGQRFMIAAEGSVTYEGVDQKTKRWCRMSTYGGRAVENITQAIARDCLAESMLALDFAGFSMLFTVHDEIVAEETEDRLTEMEQIMGRPISWAPGLPLRADGFITDWYQKETD
jgi:DNA polymerase